MTKEKFLQYEQIRKSGVTNMLAVNTVCDLSDDLTKEDCKDIITNYSEYFEKWDN